MKGKRELVARALNALLPRPIRHLVGRPGLFCLTYHRVCDQDGLDDGLISASLEDFDWQIGWLKDNVRVLSGDQILAFVRGELPLREPAIAVTFDDGYADNLAAGQVLERHHVPGILFVATSFVGTTNMPHWDRIAYAVKVTARSEIQLADRWVVGRLRLAELGR